MNMLVSSAIAGAATVSPVEAANPDAEVIAAGEKFERLLPRYMAAWFDWARLHREAKAEAEAKFGDDYHSPAWCKPNPGQSPAQAFLCEAIARNGTGAADDAVSALHDQMEPIAEMIKDADIQTLAGLRSKALVAIWDSRPIGATHDGCLNFEDEFSCYSMVTGAVAITGLSDLFGSFVEQVENDATVPMFETPKAAGPRPVDPILAAIAAHKQAYDALSAEIIKTDAMEAAIPADKRKTSLSWGDAIIETDDPRWIEFETRIKTLHEAERDAEWGLTNVVPTTASGVLALLEYATGHEERGLAWPTDGYVDDDDPKERSRSWYYFVHRNILRSLRVAA
jgi:hypothetical protein